LRRITHVSRASNGEADTLANIGSQCLPIPPGVFWEEIIERPIQNNQSSGMKKQKPQLTGDSGAAIAAEEDNLEPEEVMMIKVTWMQPYLAYMLHKTLLEDIVEARRIVRRSKAFMVVKGELYTRKAYLEFCKGVSHAGYIARHPCRSLRSPCQ
jgi:hypothetical protein